MSIGTPPRARELKLADACRSLGTLGLAASAVTSARLPELILPTVTLPSPAAILIGIVVSASSLLSLIFPATRGARWILVLMWAATMAVALVSALASDGRAQPIAYVPAVEATLLAATSGPAVLQPAFLKTRETAATGVAIVMLTLFGTIHVTQVEAIASLIPDGLPLRDSWPYLTGGAMLAAAAALLSRRSRPPAARGVALMFAAWIPLVHLPRSIADPSPFEWQFACMALALAGAMLKVGTMRGLQPTKNQTSG